MTKQAQDKGLVDLAEERLALAEVRWKRSYRYRSAAMSKAMKNAQKRRRRHT